MLFLKAKLSKDTGIIILSFKFFSPNFYVLPNVVRLYAGLLGD